MMRDDALRFTNDDVRENAEGVALAIRLKIERLRGLKGRGHP
jgi:very-short-patch-repair endonuclease